MGWYFFTKKRIALYIGGIIIPTAKYYDKSSVGIPSTKLDYHGKFVFRPTKPFKCSFTLESP